MRLINADELKELYSGDGLYTAAHFRTAIDEMPTASLWHSVKEPPKYSGKVFVLMNREGPFYDTELVADTAMYNRLPRGPVPVGTFYNGMFGESDFEDITQNVLYWMPIELPKEGVYGNK
jgi:hypothetical protein